MAWNAIQLKLLKEISKCFLKESGLNLAITLPCNDNVDLVKYNTNKVN